MGRIAFAPRMPGGIGVELAPAPDNAHHDARKGQGRQRQHLGGEDTAKRSAHGLFTAAHQALNQTRTVLPTTPAVSNAMDHVSTRSLKLGPPSISRSSHGRRHCPAWALPVELRPGPVTTQRAHRTSPRHQDRHPDLGRPTSGDLLCKGHNRLLRPLLAANRPAAPPELRTALRAIDQHVRGYIDHARLKIAA